MGYVLAIFGTLIALNFAVGDKVAELIYEESEDQGVVEVEEINAENLSDRKD